MNTIKRAMPQINTEIKNYSKYSNQMQFKGIVVDENIYDIDQKSSRDAKNVFVDDNLQLVSRPTLQPDEIPYDAVPQGDYKLVDIFDFTSGKIYISQNQSNNQYTLICIPAEYDYNTKRVYYTLQGLTKYHLCTIDQYVICFNNIDAKLLDTNKFYTTSYNWEKFTSHCEIPTTKITSENGVAEYGKNQFIPEVYKEDYLWTTNSQPNLPNNKTAKISLKNKEGEFDLGSLNINTNLIDYAIGTNTYYKYDVSDKIVSAAKSTLCIATNTYVDYSVDYGNAFKRLYYPLYNGTFLNIAEVSRDGEYFFFVTTEGVFRCNLSTQEWSNIFRGPASLLGQIIGSRRQLNNTPIYSCFLTVDTFCFLLPEYNGTTLTNVRLYFKGHGLYEGTDYTKDHMSTETAQDITDYYTLSYIDVLQATGYSANLKDLVTDFELQNYNYKSKLVNMKTFYDSYDRLVTGISIFIPSTSGSKLIMIYGGAATGRQSSYMFGYSATLTHQFSSTVGVVPITGIIPIDCEYSSNETLCTYKCIDTNSTNMSGSTEELDFHISNIKIGYFQADFLTPASLHSEYDFEYFYFGNQLSPYWLGYKILPIPLSSNYIISIGTTTIGAKIYNDSRNTNGEEQDCIPQLKYLIDNGDDVFYGANSYADLHGYTLWTNRLTGDDDIITFTVYTGNRNTATFNKVPNVSYSNTELYLGFNNVLQITSNGGTGKDIEFNLPEINDKTFIENITGMINISTTEVALFFENKIRICTKVQDENFAIQNKGFRYDYYNTKLSTGIRLGDSVINSLEGSYTVFPTLRGLAALNYQAFMATTDQVIDYISDDIKEIWTEFYEASKESGEQIKIIQWRNRLVITNNTKTILLYDLKENAWWKWEVFDDVLIALSDQVDLRVIKDELLVFKYSNKYYDMSEVGRNIPIEWYIMSQPLHFDTPNHYKNLRQLVFQFADHFKTGLPKTMNAQIKLYRKKITIRDPECVKFKIEELRTFVKRFNYWKINEVQWALSNDDETATPQPLELNAIDIKYEIGEEVR